MKHSEKAAELFYNGYNCAQAIMVAFSDVTGLEEAYAAKMISSFGGGMGRLREVCGGVSGAIMALGMAVEPWDPADQSAKAEHYRRIQLLANRFRERHGAIICRELLGEKAGTGYVPEKRTDEYYAMRPCERMVYSAAELLEDLLAELEIL